MRILIHSNSPLVSTGYGQQVALFAPRLNEHHEVAISAFYGTAGRPTEWEGMKLFPGLGDNYGDSYLLGHAKNWFDGDLRGGLVFPLMDVFVLDPTMCAAINMATWTPVDHDPLTPSQYQFFHESHAIPIAMSRFGENQLADFDPLYVPHGVDTSIFKPENKAACRRQLGLPEQGFLVGMVGANKGFPSRKSFAEMLCAFADFRSRHDDAVLVLHTETSGNYAHGENLDTALLQLGIPVDSVLKTGPYDLIFDPPPAEVMSRMYSSLDVLCHASRGEGFGVCVLEAQACGVPAIVTKFSAMPEVCGAGWYVDGQPFYNNNQRSWQRTPSIAGIIEALDLAYELPEAKRKALQAQAVEHAKGYDVETVLEDYMLPALAEAEERIGSQPRKLVAA